MAANNRVLKAAIIEHGGELRISPESVYEMLENATRRGHFRERWKSQIVARGERDS